MRAAIERLFAKLIWQLLHFEMKTPSPMRRAPPPAMHAGTTQHRLHQSDIDYTHAALALHHFKYKNPLFSQIFKETSRYTKSQRLKRLLTPDIDCEPIYRTYTINNEDQLH